MNQSSLQQAVSYFNNFTLSLHNIERKLLELSADNIPADSFNASHRKLIKLLTRATTNLRLFRESLYRLEKVPESLQEQVEQLNNAVIRFQRLFIMRSTLPENALDRFYALPIAPITLTLSNFTQDYNEIAIIP